MHPLAVGDVLRIEPQVEESVLVDVADDMLVGNALVAPQVAGVGVKQGRARADRSIPTDDTRAAFNEGANIIALTEIITGKSDVVAATQSL